MQTAVLEETSSPLSSEDASNMQRPLLGSSFLIKLNELVDDADPSKNEEPSKAQSSTSVFAFAGLLAAGSCLIFFFSAQEAAARYLEIIMHDNLITFEWMLSAFSGVTNMLFNWEAYIDVLKMTGEYFNVMSRGLQDASSRYLKLILALIAGVGTISPYWAVASGTGSNEFVNALINVSTVLNVPVFMQGTYGLYELANHARIQRLQLQCSLFCSSKSQGEISKKIQATYLKEFLITELRQRREDFYYASRDERSAYMTSISEGQGSELYKLLNAALIEFSSLPEQKNIIDQSTCLKVIKYGVLGSLCLIQNFGHVIEAFKAGQTIYGAGLGVLFAMANIIPGLAFSFKGIMGFGLIEVAFESMLAFSYCFGSNYFKRTSQLQRLWECNNPGAGVVMIALFMFSALMIRLSYILSGFGGDAVGYDACIEIKFGVEAAWVVGVLSNIGSVVFNGPQCELWLTKCREKLISHLATNKEDKQHLLCMQQSAATIATFEAASPEDMIEFSNLDDVKMILENATFASRYSLFCESKQNKVTNAPAGYQALSSSV